MKSKGYIIQFKMSEWRDELTDILSTLYAPWSVNTSYNSNALVSGNELNTGYTNVHQHERDGYYFALNHVPDLPVLRGFSSVRGRGHVLHQQPSSKL